MAIWDSADLLGRCKRHAARPATDTGVDDADWYAWLTEAQAHWLGIFATHLPGAAGNAVVEKLTTPDSGKTYTLGSYPVGLAEVYATRRGGRLRVGTSSEDPSLDFIAEGQTLRVPGGRTRTFADGPWARYIPISATAEISASSQPTLQPAPARMLLVWRALALWAGRPPMLADPQYYLDRETEEWSGTADGQKIGWLHTLKNQWGTQGLQAIPSDGGVWWHNPDMT